MVWLRAKARRVYVRDGVSAADPMIELAPNGDPVWFHRLSRAQFATAHDVSIVDNPPPVVASDAGSTDLLAAAHAAAAAPPKRKRGRPRKKPEA